MKLCDLPGFERVPDGFRDTEISGVTEDSRKAAAETVFVCICGTKRDGHDLAPDAYRNGCRIFLSQKELSLPGDALTVRVPDTRRALAALACRFFGNPSREIRVICVTGTKGKTTVALMISGILNRCGIPCGYIGTNGISFARTARETGNTTPDAVTLQKTLREMADQGIRAAVLEVSSQALLQFRADGTHPAAAIFTNLSPDHIGNGEHPDFENYKACKQRLFREFGAPVLIGNADDPATGEMLGTDPAVTRILCSASGNRTADYRAEDLSLSPLDCSPGIGFTLADGDCRVPVHLPMIGLHNAQNALLAVATANALFGISPASAAKALADIRIPGRSELIPLGGGAVAVIDYAHNGVSLRALLRSLREYRPERLICLFGSVGERTKLRRAELGEAAAELADLSILTSDNPGKEDPEAIIEEIAIPFRRRNKPFTAIPDRAEAIRYALRAVGRGDILVLAGKGHETYQLIGEKKIPFSEREILNEFLLTRS